jgi:hypothetical protein
MPLASSLTSVQKRAEAVERERRQQERRHAVVTGRRVSLPSTIPSSTVATKAKVERRRSIRRESSSKSLQLPGGGKPPAKAPPNQENQAPVPNHYSPPQTRSAKKKKINPDFMNYAMAAAESVLQFSPPNQAENQRLESERIQRQEEERYVLESSAAEGKVVVQFIHLFPHQDSLSCSLVLFPRS